MTQEQFIEIIEWQKLTFGSSTPLSKLAHLKEELIELENDLKSDSPNKAMEFADCFFLLFGAAAADGMMYEDICNAIAEKFEINKKRQWGKPDENGVVKHVKQDEKKERLEARVAEFRNCKTPEEMAYNIWTKQLEELVGDRSSYRIPFIEWVECYKNGAAPKWRYQTPKDLVEALWPVYLDQPNDQWFTVIRAELIAWIENYAKS